jgi:hypothetical protein
VTLLPNGFWTPLRLFHLEDSTNGFPQLFQLCSHITQGHIPRQIAHILGTTHLLIMTKPSSGVCPIVVGEIDGDIIQFNPFLHAFYAFESPLFYSHWNFKSEVIVIPFAMGTHQGDPLGGALFVLHSTTSHFSFLLFSSIIDDIHIIGPFLIVSSTYEHF